MSATLSNSPVTQHSRDDANHGRTEDAERSGCRRQSPYDIKPHCVGNAAAENTGERSRQHRTSVRMVDIEPAIDSNETARNHKERDHKLPECGCQGIELQAGPFDVDGSGPHVVPAATASNRPKGTPPFANG